MEIRKNLIHEPSEGLTCMSPSRTCQEFKTECDVNNIIDNYVGTGVLRHVNMQTPIFGDFSEVPQDYGEAVQFMDKSREAFMTLPSKVRDRFDNNPANLVKFMQDEGNRDEAVKLGLINEKVNEDEK